jgi:hypothetical protein
MTIIRPVFLYNVSAFSILLIDHDTCNSAGLCGAEFLCESVSCSSGQEITRDLFMSNGFKSPPLETILN